jgi:hypothetical protein
MIARRPVLLVGLALALGACASVPAGPSVMVLPGRDKSFEAFQADDELCRGWAEHQTGASPVEAVDRGTAKGAAVGAGLGAAAGALIGAASHDAGPGALFGAGAGLLLGSAAGSSHGYAAGYSLQQRYDAAYTQCMYANDNQVPMARSLVSDCYAGSLSHPPRPTRSRPGPGIPRPPAGPPPPPPPGAE